MAGTNLTFMALLNGIVILNEQQSHSGKNNPFGRRVFVAVILINYSKQDIAIILEW